jgi:hypothetical protein
MSPCYHSDPSRGVAPLYDDIYDNRHQCRSAPTSDESPNLRKNQRPLTAAAEAACAPEQEVARSSRAGPMLRSLRPTVTYRQLGRFAFYSLPCRGVVPGDKPHRPEPILECSACCSIRNSTTSDRCLHCRGATDPTGYVTMHVQGQPTLLYTCEGALQ